MTPAAAVMTAAALAGALSLAACTGRTDHAGPVPGRTQSPASTTSAGPHGGPMIPATATAPGYLSTGYPHVTLSGTLPRVPSVTGSAVSLPWIQMSRDENSGTLTVELDDGGCITVPFGYTATTYKHTVIIGIYSTSTLPSGEACAGAGHLAVYRLTLPAADARLSLAHATYL